MPDSRAPERPALRTVAARAVQSLVVALGIALAAAQLGAYHFMLDNLANFAPQLAAGFAFAAAALVLLGRRRWAAWSALGAALAFAPVAPWYLGGGARATEPAAGAARLLVSNVYFRNREYRPLIALLAEERPDVIALVEVTPEWLRALEPIRAGYPYRFETPDESYAGFALYSRLPFSDARELRLRDTQLPAVAATLATRQGPVELLLVHAIAPVSAEFALRRNRQIRAIASYAATRPHPLVVAGDLNVTTWNRHYRPLELDGRLRNARAGRGIGATWPDGWPLSLPLDHVLASEQVALANFRVLPSVGSDHRPIAAEFARR